jgi:hypothetical protein
MESTNHAIKQVLDELFTLLETMEAQSIAILQFLKDQKISSDERLSPYLDQASKAASVKWRAARVRMDYLFSSTENKPRVSDEAKEKAAESKKAEENEARDASAETANENGAAKQETGATPAEEKAAANPESSNSLAKEPEKAENEGPAPDKTETGRVENEKAEKENPALQKRAAKRA